MWLALETATDRLGLAIGSGAEGAVRQLELAGARQHARALLPMADALLREAGIGPRDLTGVVVADGPGSFTGLRVGAAVAKALVRSGGLELRTAPSLLVRAVAAGVADAPVLAVANALRGEVYAAAYRLAGGRVETLLAPGVFRPAELMERLPAPGAVVGEAPPETLAALASWTGHPVVTPPAGAPRAAMLLALLALDGGTTAVADAAGWEPVYGRPAEAQARWEQTHGRPLAHPGGAHR